MISSCKQRLNISNNISDDNQHTNTLNIASNYNGFCEYKSEKTFTQGGPSGCGIAGSFCGCGSGK